MKSTAKAVWALVAMLEVFGALDTRSGQSQAGEIGWIESYALAEDRAGPLKQLIPGTEVHYYYHCLYYQSTEQWAKVDDLLKSWVERYNWTPRAIEIQNRQALLTYKQDPNRSLELIRNRLGLRFDQQRELLDQKPNLPTKLDPALLSRKQLNQQAFQQFPNTLQGFEDAALDWLVAAELNPDQRRQLLARLQRPDYPNLVSLVLADLAHENSGGFGQFEIHRRLLLSQLDECLKERPDLRNQSNFVQTYLLRLRPSNDVNWRQDPSALKAYLDRLWSFVGSLEPAHNSLKAHVLYHRLVLDRQQGKIDPERFLEYLRLPKQTVYISPKFMESPDQQRLAANLQQDFTAITQLPPIGNDEPLVRGYLETLFVDAENTKAYEPYVNDQYLRQVFAETKIVHGLGDAEKWVTWLTPEAYQSLKERIDLDFDPTNKTEFETGEPVRLDLHVKNVETLIVKVFRINTGSFYRQNLREVGPEINLDGLVANEEKTHTFREPALRRVRRHFEFPSLDPRGVYVIDFIGNGKSSRALIRKGKLRYLVKTTAAGQAFTVFDDQNTPVPDATLWLSGIEYRPDEQGVILTPFSNQPGRQAIVLSHKDFSSLEFFAQEAEQYALNAGFYVDREQLIGHRKAELLVRPRLTVNGVAAPLGLLENVRLTIISTDLDNVSSMHEVSDFKLYEDRESVTEFRTPPRVASLRFRLTARVQNQSQNQKVDLAAEQAIALNEIDRSDKTEDLHFSKIGEDYRIDLLGKTGEAKNDRPVQLALKLRDYTQPVNVTLQSDAQGRVLLGTLPGVASVTATGPQGTAHSWQIRRDEHTYPLSLHGDPETPLEVPYMGPGDQPRREELSLLELRDEAFVADRFDNLAIEGGLLTIQKLPPGDYSLLIKSSGTQIRLRLTEGVRRQGYVMGKYRKLEAVNSQPLQIEPIEITKEGVRIRLRNASAQSRVHVFATRFQPAYDAYANFSRIGPPAPYSFLTPQVQSQYVAGRDLGDEYRYILDRQRARKYPGNMLERPSLLLNPWAVRSTETGQQVAQAGDDFAGEAPPMEQAGGRDGGLSRAVAPQSDFANLDFLAESSLVLANVQPDEKGVIVIPREKLGPRQELVFLAIDREDTACRLASLPSATNKFLDLRLSKGLNPERHFTQQQRISILAAGERLTIEDITSTRFETYDSLSRAYALYATLNRDPKLEEFEFVRDWASLPVERKKELYSKFASHELHLFLYEKDREFFDSAIRPYLANKKEKQFIDRWLLEENLDESSRPWDFQQLNTLERILLGRRRPGEAEKVSKIVSDQFDLLPADRSRFNLLFQTALRGGALQASDSLGRGEALEKAAELPMLQRELLDRAAGGMPAPASDQPAAPPPGAVNGQVVATEAFAEMRAGAKMDSAKQLGLRAKDGALAEQDKEQQAEFKKMARLRATVAQYYRTLDQTKEWAESNYYKLPLDQQTVSLITANAFWKDLASQDAARPFFSVHLAEPTHSFPEMLAALALQDLPFKAAEHKTEFSGGKMTLTAGSPMIVYREEVQLAAKVAEPGGILVSENFFRQGDRYRQVQGEQVDKFVSEQFVIDAVYGCHVVVTNPGSSKKKVDVLLQIPTGALPLANGQATRSVHLDLEPYRTQTLEYFFYFPSAGKFPHYPVQVSSNDEVLAFAAPFNFNVVEKLTGHDKESWDYISQYGSDADVLDFLTRENLFKVDLGRMAWRLRDKKFFTAAIGKLADRRIYNHTVWSFGVLHDDPASIRHFLQFANDFVAQSGDWLDSPLLVIDPIERHNYEHLDYRPLVNARVGQLGRRREILNDRFLAQYQRLLKILSYRRELNDTELLALTYYLLLQERTEEALEFFGRVHADRLATRMQYDYFAAYLSFSQADPVRGREIALKYADYPVDRWRVAFANIVNQANEVDAKPVQVADEQDQSQIQNRQAATAPTFDFVVEAQTVKLDFQNLREVQVNYYLMDVELLFSRNPFVQGDAKQFANIQPNLQDRIELPADKSHFEFPLPKELAGKNLLVEIVGAGQSSARAYYSNALRVQLVENFGQVRVGSGESSKPLPKAYVKAYARMKDGSIRFYKDGYTDLRGRFDYASLSTNELDFVDRFSLLILSEDQGAVVREAAPPKR